MWRRLRFSIDAYNSRAIRKNILNDLNVSLSASFLDACPLPDNIQPPADA
jgi:hypothetical protein